MTRKDYALIGGAMICAKPPFLGQTGSESEAAKVQYDRCVAALIVALRYDNPRFDPVRFIKACGI